MTFAFNRTTRIYYEIKGNPQGPPLLMLKGLARSRRYWHRVADLFETHFRVIHMDNRGVGRSDSPRPPYTTREMAGDVAAVIAAAGLGRVDYFGISLAGMIGQWLAIDHSTLVNRVVLAATTMGGFGNSITAGALLGLARSFGQPLHVSVRDTSPLVLTDRFLETNPEIVNSWERFAREEPSPWYGLLGQSLAGATHDTRAHIHRVQAETLVITGDADRLIPCQRSYGLAERIPNARLRVLPGLGHDFPTENPELTFEVISDFLSRPFADRPRSAGHRSDVYR